MIKEIDIKVFPDQLYEEEYIKSLCISKANCKAEDVRHVKLIKRSIDARGDRPFYLIRALVYLGEDYKARPMISEAYRNVSDGKRVAIIGAGPAGYFAALECLELGLKPILFERGKDVQSRRRDLKAIQQDGIVNPNSNYCFGEGGAGTYSDGKLYTRSTKRGNPEKVLRQLVEHGAKADILIDAHPHIGSNKLPDIIAEIRKTILSFGGEIFFNTPIVDFVVENNKMKGVVSQSGDHFTADAFVLATGHSARDIYHLLQRKNIAIEAKPFALGVRIEHHQAFIDQIQYHQSPREVNLPAASYKAVCQVNHTGVFSFCMCPGGLIVPSATSPGEIVVNGMSLSRRDSAFANSGLVTSIEIEELHDHGYKGVFACLDFQSEVEQKMFQMGDGSQKAPAQRVDDFVHGKTSNDLFPTSYIPGIFSAPLHEALPQFVADRLRVGLKEINKKMKGYLSHDANIVATESRTSAPVRIPRDKVTFMHTTVEALFPSGEGAGVAGGILSAAMDGQNVARAIAAYLR